MICSSHMAILQFGVYSAIPCRDIQNVRQSYMYKCGCLADNCRNASRRNGKPASCEPCRINKTRCDHGMPKCDRCKQRGIEERCFYHPAPLTKPRTTTDDAGTGESRPLKRKYACNNESHQTKLTKVGDRRNNTLQSLCFP
jgi:hypothetical protein